MDTSTTAGLSLDELTFELSRDDSLKQEVIFGEPEDSKNIYITRSNFSGQEPDTSKAVAPDENADGHGTQELKMMSLSGSGFLDNKVTAQVPDFEDDVSLSFVSKSSRVDAVDDSDSEFEVPERPVSLALEKTSSAESNRMDTVTAPSKISSAYQGSKSNQDVTVNLNLPSSVKIQPEIISDHEKVTVDSNQCFQNSSTLPLTSLEVAFLPNQSYALEFSAASGKTDVLTNESGHEKNDAQRPNEDSIMKDELVRQTASHTEPYHLEENARQEVISMTSATKEGNRNSAEHQQKPCIVTTATDWEEIETIEPGFLQSSNRVAGPKSVIESKPLAAFPETWELFKVADYSSVKAQIKPNIERRGFSAFTHLLFGPPKLHKDLLPQRELIFCIAATPFDNENDSHIRVLQTIYRCLTGSKFDCQRFGGHWEEIGFQGRDPATDLRGTGMLALLHLLYFLRNPNTKDLARDVYKLSLHPTQNFPFCVMGINLSRICLQVLREDLFNKECNNRKEVVNTVNGCYTALFLHLYREWKKGKTIVDSGFVLQETETYCRKHSKTVLKDLETYEKTKKQQGQSRKDSNDDPSFYNVCKEDEVKEKSPAELY